MHFVSQAKQFKSSPPTKLCRDALPDECGAVVGAGFAHWVVLVRGRQVAKAQKILAVQWRLVHLHADVLLAWHVYAHKLQACSVDWLAQVCTGH